MEYIRDRSFPRTTITWVISILVVAELSRFAFQAKVTKRIKRRAGGKCECCGTDATNADLIAAHKNHARGPMYNRTTNGMALCRFCETEYHLKHGLHPQQIGMRVDDNNDIIKGHLSQLPEEEQAILRERYRDILAIIEYRIRS